MASRCRCSRWPRGAHRGTGATRPSSPAFVGPGHDDGIRSHVGCHPRGNRPGLALGDAHERTRLHCRRARRLPGLAGRRLLPCRQTLLASPVVRRFCRDCGDVLGRRLLLRTTRLPPGGAARSPLRGPCLRRIYLHFNLCPVQPQFYLDGNALLWARRLGGLLHSHARGPGGLRDPLRAIRAHPAERDRARTRFHPGIAGCPAPPVSGSQGGHGAGGARSSRSQAPGGGDSRGARPGTRRRIVCRARVLD